MDFSKLSNVAKLALIAGAVLVVNLFLPWYGVFGISLNAFDADILAWGGSLVAIAGAVVLLLKAMGTKDVNAGQFKPEQYPPVDRVVDRRRLTETTRSLASTSASSPRRWWPTAPSWNEVQGHEGARDGGEPFARSNQRPSMLGSRPCGPPATMARGLQPQQLQFVAGGEGGSCGPHGAWAARCLVL